MKKVFGAIALGLALGLALGACSLPDYSDENGYDSSEVDQKEDVQNCVNSNTGEVIDPSYCFDNVPGSLFYYYYLPLTPGNFIEVEDRYKQKPAKIKPYTPPATKLPAYTPAPKPATPVKPVPVYTPPKAAPAPVNKPPVVAPPAANKPAPAPPARVAPPAPKAGR